MRKCIRSADAEGFERIAVVCGAYHTPALADMPPARHDDDLLRGLTKVKTEAAWVPWSYERFVIFVRVRCGHRIPGLVRIVVGEAQGAGARSGSRAPRGCYQGRDIPVSAAHVIEACRLADALAAVRGSPVPGFVEYNDAAVSVLGNGDALNLQLIERRWHFDDRLGPGAGGFPRCTPAERSRCVTTASALAAQREEKTLDLDLREEHGSRAQSYAAPAANSQRRMGKVGPARLHG